jgi:eukaryotic-like serine/threonine-protein kinase
MPTPMTQLCSQCGKPLPPDGDCPVCALKRALALSGQASEAQVIEQAGDRIGRYKLLEKIGEGGYGIVYMAEQAEPIRRPVALKIVKLGMDTRQVIARFEAERQALALMDHPNIARIFDAGITGAPSSQLSTTDSQLHFGRPYFVMELVRGIKITDYCDQHSLSTRERLDLFIQVCHAVQHAHQKGIIHRDLKPSNVLVTQLDGKPVPKVIDFGIAKATGQQLLTDKTLFTAFQQFIGTPAYMSPEQAGMSGEDIDTRSDIYSLGVLLYELLSGYLPFEKQDLVQAGFDEMRRIIREKEPPKPSTRLATALAANPHSALRTPQLKEVRGDLDWIVMKCLEKERARRYETASGLAHDVLRHLSNEPVEARPPGGFYRFRKLVRRNRLVFGAASAVALALATGLSLSTWMFVKEKQARQRLELRAYLSDMGAAMRTAAMRTGLGGVVKLLDAWRNHKPDLRGWEWHYLNALCHQDVLTIRADTNELWSVAWSPDGSRLATGGTEGVVKIWDALSGRQLASLRGHTGELRSVAWSPDGRRLASAGLDRKVKVWDLEHGHKATTMSGHQAAVVCVAWSPDGSRLASGSTDTTVKIWDPATGTNTQTLPAQRRVFSVSWTSNGARLAACGAGQMVRVWDLSSAKEVWSTEVSGDRWSITFSPDGKQLATGGGDLTVNIRDAANGTNVTTYWGHRNWIYSVSWEPQGTRLVSASGGDGMIMVWDTLTGTRLLSFLGHIGAVRCVAWRMDGSRIASAGMDGTVKVWDVNRPHLTTTTLQQPDQVSRLAWHPNGSQLATSGRRSSVWVWDLTGVAGPVVLPGKAEWTWALRWNPAGIRLAYGDSEGVVRVWDLTTRAEVWQAKVFSNSVRAVAWSPDSKRLASVGGSTQLKIWDAAAGKLLSTVAVRNGGPWALEWSPDGSRLAVGVQYVIQILDAVTGKECRLLKGHTDEVRSIVWSPDGKRLASAASDASAKIWDPARGQEIQTLLGHAGTVDSVAWSPDGTRLVTGGGDSTVRIWEPVSGVEICSLVVPGDMVRSVAWSPDGTRLAYSDAEGVIRILDSAPGQTVKGLATSRTSSGRTERVAADTIRSLKLYCEAAEPQAAHGDADALRRLAWIYATCPYPELRDGGKAVACAEKALTVSSRKNAGLLDILAAACAEAGDFPGAISAEKEAIGLLQSEEAKREFASRLKLYEAHMPYRDNSW